MQQSTNLKFKATRDGLGEGLLELGKTNPQMVVLSADLSESTRANWFKEKYPNRFIEVGVAEQNMIGVAAGLAQEGFIPFCTSFSAFSPGRNWEQIRVSVCYNQANVKIVSTHAGISVGADGATHQSTEDIALMLSLPNMTVISPCDYFEALKATIASSKINGPCYLRFSRLPTPIITAQNDQFEIGKANIIKKGKDVTIFCHGIMVQESIKAQLQMQKSIDAEIINVHTLKPLDNTTILKSLKKTGRAIVAEEAVKSGSLFSAISQLVVENYPCPIQSVALNSFGESGDPKKLMVKYHISSNDIIKAVKKLK